MRAHPAGPRHADQVAEPGLPAVPADLNALDPHVWPTGLARASSGALAVHGVDVRDLVGELGSPLQVVDQADFLARARGFHDAFAVRGEAEGVPADVFYAGKAFLCTEVARWVEAEGLGLDLASGGELTVALRAGFPPDRLVLHGNNKSVPEMRRAVEAGVGRFVLDSRDEIDRLAAVAGEAGRRARVLVRVTVGVEAHTHEYIATAHEDQKFGFSLVSGEAREAVAAVVAAPSLELVGLHSHIGSQIFDTAGFELAAHRLVGLLAQVRDDHGIELAELDLGGGLGIAYVSSDDPADVFAIAESLREVVRRETAAYGLSVPRLAVEPGRAVAGPAGITVYEVGTVKPVALDRGLVRTYVSVDGGMSDNIRTALYDAEFTTVLASRSSDAPPMLTRVVGKHCESGDVVVRDAWLPADLRPGDLVAVAATGAYCRSMASSYNYLPRLAVVAVAADGGRRLLLRRETEDDMLALDPGA